MRTTATSEQAKAKRTVIAEALRKAQKAQARIEDSPKAGRQPEGHSNAGASRALAERRFSLRERVELRGAERHRLVKLDADLVRPERGPVVREWLDAYDVARDDAAGVVIQEDVQLEAHFVPELEVRLLEKEPCSGLCEIGDHRGDARRVTLDEARKARDVSRCTAPI
jgi:hypothetical protein